MGPRDEQRRNGKATEAGADTDVDVVVVGAGLAGLTAALVAARGGARVRILDAHQPGGRAATTQVECGAVFNSGPRALYRGGAGIQVLRSLGIEPTGERPPTEGHGIRGAFIGELPSGPISMFRTRLLRPGSKFRAGALLGRLNSLDPDRYDDQTLSDFLDERRLPEDARQVVLAAIRIATYIADEATFSAGVAIRQLQMALGEGVLYLDHGWQQLVDAFIAKLREHDVAVEAGAAVRRLEPLAQGGTGAGWVVHTPAGQVRTRSVVLAAGGVDAVDSLLPVSLDRRGLGEPATAACLELAVRGAPARRFLIGLDEPMYLSDHSTSADLAPDGIHVVQVLRYGARSTDQDRPALWAHARAAGIRESDVVAHRYLRRMMVTAAIPIAAAGGLRGRPPVPVPGADGLFMAGDWVGDTGMLADAAIASGDLAGRVAAERAGTSPMARPGVAASAR